MDWDDLEGNYYTAHMGIYLTETKVSFGGRWRKKEDKNK